MGGIYSLISGVHGDVLMKLLLLITHVHMT